MKRRQVSSGIRPEIESPLPDLAKTLCAINATRPMSNEITAKVQAVPVVSRRNLNPYRRRYSERLLRDTPRHDYRGAELGESAYETEQNPGRDAAPRKRKM